MTHLTRARQQAALQLFQNFLTNMAHALAHVDNELHNTNPWPSSTTGNGHISSGGSPSSPVERIVIDSQHRLRNDQQELWDDYNAIMSICTNGSQTANRATRERVPVTEGRCTFGTTSSGWEGWTHWRNTEPRHDPDGNQYWHNTECQKWPATNPIIPNMCDDCLTRMNKWRDTVGLERVTRNADARTYKRGSRGRFSSAS